MDKLIRFGSYSGITLGVLLILAIIFRIGFVTFVDNYELGYSYNSITGDMKLLDRQGYIFAFPFVMNVHTIDLRPTQVCINANSRVLNCKLVQFNPDGWKLFVDWHGRDDYYNSNMNSPTSGNLNQILMSYAYEGTGKEYPFLKILRELKSDENVDSNYVTNSVIINDSIQ